MKTKPPPNTLFFTPGPTKLHPVAVAELSRIAQGEIASRSHRSTWFEGVFSETVTELRGLLSIPVDYTIAFVGSATETWERWIENVVDHRSHHIVNGEFADRFFACARALGRQPSVTQLDPRGATEFSSITVPADAETLCVTVNETSSGMVIPPSELQELARQRPDVLVAADIVSAVPYYSAPWEHLDCGFFSVQKGFGLPAGLGVVVLSPRAVARTAARRAAGKIVGTYHAFDTLAAAAARNQTPETPNVVGIYLLGKVAAAYRAEGIEAIRQSTEARAARLFKEVPSLLQGAPLVTVERYRSVTSIAFLSSLPVSKIHEKLKACGVVIGAGYGPFKDSGIRIANFPMHTEEEVALLLAALREAVDRL